MWDSEEIRATIQEREEVLREHGLMNEAALRDKVLARKREEKRKYSARLRAYASKHGVTLEVAKRMRRYIKDEKT